MKKIWIIGAIALSLVAFTGCAKKVADNNSDSEFCIVLDEESMPTEPASKVIVNISGIITDIRENGKEIKVDDKWVLVDEHTDFSGDPDDGADEVSTEFQVGNLISGFSLDPKADKVVAVAIYTNMPSDTDQITVKPLMKVAVNISGEVTEVSEDGKRVKIDDLWITVNENTTFKDDPDNGSLPVSQEFNLGNYVSGFSQDLEAEEVVAIAIYQNQKK